MPSTPDATDPDGPAREGSVVVYWRPGCPWCSRLLRWVDKAELPVERRNIWDEPEAAEAVRAITGGDETVPTVTVGEVALVNPSPRELASTIREQLPGQLPDDDGHDEPWRRRVGRGD